jgi:DHA2 family multidrug resistance protein
MGMLITSRVVQGLGGGAILPIGQAIMLEDFPPEKRGLAMAIFGFGIIFAPIIGPTLGGWITDTYSWHWIFLINVPVGFVAIALGKMFIEDPPYARKTKIEKVDYVGFLLLIVWLFSLQIILDNGQKYDWFDASWVKWTTFLSLSAFAGFIWRELATKTPIVDLRVFLNRNFATGLMFNAVIGAVLYSTLAILPLFLQHLMGYTATLSGLAISPRGFGSIAGLLFVAYFANRLDQRYVVMAGIFLLACSNIMFSSLNLDIGMINIILPNVLCGFSFSLLMIPLMTVSFATLRNDQMTNASGLFSLARSVGGAIGTSIVATMISRMAQVHQTYLVRNITYSNPVFSERLAALQSALSAGFGQYIAGQKANLIIYMQLQQQANLLAFMDCFKIYAVALLILTPFVFVFRKVKYKKSKNNEEMGAMH